MILDADKNYGSYAQILHFHISHSTHIIFMVSCTTQCTSNFKIENLHNIIFSHPQASRYNQLQQIFKMLVNQVYCFKAIDDLIQSQNDANIKVQLFDKKMKMIQLVESGKLTPDKYQAMCKKSAAETKFQQIKDSIQFQMISLDGNTAEWFKDLMDQTKQKIEEQAKKLGKPIPKVELKQKQKKQQPKKEQKKQQKKEEKKQIKPNPSMNRSSKKQVSPVAASTIDASKIYSFKVLDSLMEENGSDKKLYMSLFEQKQKMMQIVKEKKLNAQSYCQMLEKQIKSSSNEDVVLSLQMELDELKDFHAGNIQAWFKDRIEETEQSKQQQQQKYTVMKTGKSQAVKVKDDIDPDVQQITANIAEKVKTNKLPSGTKLFCFKFLDEEMQKNEDNSKQYCRLYEEKLKCIGLIQNGEVGAQTYRDMLAQIIDQSSDEDLKDAADMEVSLHDITGDVMQFFQGSLNETGENLQQQQKKYNKFTGGKGQKLKLNQAKTQQNQMQIQIPKQIRPNISEIVSFTVLVQFLNKFKKDYDYCVELKEKGSKLMKQVQDKKLGPNSYVLLLQKKLPDVQDRDIAAIMKKQLKLLKQSKDFSKQFKDIVSSYLNKVKVDLGNRGSYNTQTTFNEMTINEAQPNIKVQYLLSKLAKYESLLVYYKNNKLQKHLNDFQSGYEDIKKKTLSLCQKIKNGDDKSMDVHAYVQQKLPPISFAVLHRQSRNSYNEKLDATINKIKVSNTKIGQYAKGLKKGTNRNNIEESAKMIDKNNKMIAYLQGLKKKDMIPFPNIEQVKIEMYNLDLNKNLTENQIQVIVTNFEGIRDSLILEIFMIDKKSPRFTAKVQDGAQKNIDVIIKIPQETMEDIIKGSSHKYLSFKLQAKGWFSNTLVAEAQLELNFIRSNRMQDRLVLKDDKIFMDYVINVQKPKKPLVTEIMTIKITECPQYKHDKFVETQFIKTVMPFEKPTQSQIVP